VKVVASLHFLKPYSLFGNLGCLQRGNVQVCGFTNRRASFISMQAIQILSWLAKYKPKTLVKHKLVAQILSVICPILAEPESRVHEDDIACERAVAEVLDTMATSLPKKHVFPPVLHFAVSNFHNSDPNYRDAAVMSLGVISEGCYEVMKTRLEEVLSLVLEALKDKEQVHCDIISVLGCQLHLCLLK